MHFLVKIFGYSKKKQYLCMLFRGMPCLTRTYVNKKSGVGRVKSEWNI